MEIEVNDYVRTKRGYIGKVIKIRERIETYKNNREAYLVDWSGKKATYISQIKNIKHSKNITDLIEERRLCEWKRSLFGRWKISNRKSRVYDTI